MFGGVEPPEGVTQEFMNALLNAETREDVEKLMQDPGQFSALLNDFIEKESINAAANLFEGCALHYAAVRQGDWEGAEKLAGQIAKRALELSMAHGMNRQKAEEKAKEK